MRRLLAWDVESHLLKQGLLTPRLVCVSYARDDGTTGVLDRLGGLAFIRKALLDDDTIMIAHHQIFDLAVMCAEDPSLLPLVFAKLQKGLTRDTKVRQQLLDIATGELKFVVDDEGNITPSKYDLASLSWRLLNVFVKKTDTWRLRYAELDGVPIDQWPADAYEYAVTDSVRALEIYLKQDELAGVPHEVPAIPNQDEQHRASWALYLMSVWGIRTDGNAVVSLKRDLERDYAEFMEKLRPTGLIKQLKKKGAVSDSKDMKSIKSRVEMAFLSKGIQAPRTDPSDRYPAGQIATDKKTMLASGDPDLKNLAEVGAISKLLNTYVPVLESGTKVPITPSYNVLVETGRTSCSRPNCQNPPRKGGVRECFVPRRGWAYVFCDYSTLELRTLAQANLDLFGESRMAEVLRSGQDLHLNLAATILGITVEEATRRLAAGDPEVEEKRQLAKISNFGLPGGLSPKTFVAYADGFGITISLELAEQIHAAFFESWPEMVRYFEHVEMLANAGEMVQLRSGRKRGGVTYCSAANSYFQALASDGSKRALWNVARECYVDSSSPLFGSRPVLFLHDEIGLETPWSPTLKSRASAAAKRLSQVMIESMSQWVPDVPILAEPVMCRRWYKGAKPVADTEGDLIPCLPETVIGPDGKKRTKWVADASS